MPIDPETDAKTPAPDAPDLKPGQVPGAFDASKIRPPSGPAKGKGKPAPKGKPGRPKGSRDAPDSPRQQAARENQIRQENAERDKELLRAAEKDPSLREWVDVTPESCLPIYDLSSATIRMATGLPGLSKEQPVREEWCRACAACINYYKLDLFNHPLFMLGAASFIAATPSIAAYRVLKRLEKTIKEQGKDSAEARALLQECERLGVEIVSTSKDKAA